MLLGGTAAGLEPVVNNRSLVLRLINNDGHLPNELLRISTTVCAVSFYV